MNTRTIKRRNGSAETHHVYENIKEFRSYYPTTPVLTNWYNAQPGDWVWSDDHRIVQILKRNSNPKCTYVETVVGTFPTDGGRKMDTDFSMHPKRHSFSGQPTGYFKFRRKEIKAFAVAFLITGNARVAWDTVFGHLRHNHYKFNRKKVIQFLSHDGVIDMVREEISKAAESAGMNIEDYFKMAKKLFKESESDNIKLDVLRELKNALDIGPEKQQNVPIGLLGYGAAITAGEVAEVEGSEVKSLPEVKGLSDEGHTDED